ncbi:MAG: RNA-binding S4 domain-containing protein [Inhella sp.]|uniref:RNA-binding S4 domain-containing protein n=1 Tax=Inhella sp. TaxID=1921806 RepID=UPI00391F6FB9
MTAPLPSIRLDKWRWAARVFKTRALAVEAVERQRVRLQGQPVKPGRDVRVGDRLQLVQPGWVREVIVRGLSSTRGPAPVAQALYEDTPESLQAAAAAAERRHWTPEPADALRQGRPTKRDRRQLDAWEAADSPPRWDRWSATWPESGEGRKASR